MYHTYRRRQALWVVQNVFTKRNLDTVELRSFLIFDIKKN